MGLEILKMTDYVKDGDISQQFAGEIVTLIKKQNYYNHKIKDIRRIVICIKNSCEEDSTSNTLCDALLSYIDDDKFKEIK